MGYILSADDEPTRPPERWPVDVMTARGREDRRWARKAIVAKTQKYRDCPRCNAPTFDTATGECQNERTICLYRNSRLTAESGDLRGVSSSASLTSSDGKLTVPLTPFKPDCATDSVREREVDSALMDEIRQARSLLIDESEPKEIT